MAFLFKSKKNQDREKDRVLTSREGPPPNQPASLSSIGARIAKDEKSALQQRSTPTGSLTSLDNDRTAASASPDQTAPAAAAANYGRRPQTADQAPPSQPSDAQYRNGPGPNVGNSNMSLYPWSQRRLTYTSTSLSPFPRYGASVNATASKEGDIYVMGGLINSQTVKGDLWLIEAGGNMSCYQLATTAEGPSPRVGHSSLLVGNAFIVYGGDTKIDESDVLDETLYLLNTSTRQWSRALPSGPRPSGRYGHSLNILGSKIYIFGGQVEGFFMNDLAAFDLNQLQMPNNRWEILIPNEGGPNQGKAPPARTNHSMVSYNDKMYLFGGTNGFQWFNDVWCYDPAANAWSQLDCIGYIPVEREGHAAALVDDVMYVFGGRTEEGVDLGDLAAFRISSRRWYTFQNMGPSPSPRSGHSMTSVGKSIAVLGGEPSSATSAVNDLALVYVLDTTKIRYPNDSQTPNPSKVANGARRPSDAARLAPSRDGSQGPGPGRLIGAAGNMNSTPNGFRSPPNNADANGGSDGPSSPVTSTGSRLPRAAGPSPPTTSPPQGQPPKPGPVVAANANRARTASSERRGYGSPARSNSAQAQQSPVMRDSPKDLNGTRTPSAQGSRSAPAKAEREREPAPLQQSKPSLAETQSAAIMATSALSKSRRPNGPESIENGPDAASKPTAQVAQAVQAMQAPPTAPPPNRPSSPPPPTARQGGTNPLARRSSGRNSQTVAVLKELDAARNRNAWYASELELARKAGYTPNANLSPALDGRETFDDDDKPLIEALLAMRTELANVQASVDKQAVLAAKQVAEAEKQRDAAIREAIYAKAKLASHLGGDSTSSTPQTDSDREMGADRSQELNRKLGSALASQKELQAQLERTASEVGAEKQARKLADETLSAAERRMAELETYKQTASYELERLKAELHSSQREAREQSGVAAEAAAAMQMLRLEKEQFERQFNEAAGSARSNDDSLASLREALAASAGMKSLLEEKLEQERTQREAAETKLAQIKTDLETRTVEVVTLTQRLRDAEELSERHAAEARTHQQAVLNGLDKIQARDLSDSSGRRGDADRIVALQGQLEAAKALVKRHQLDADTASDRLRSAEERIAGLEAYQEQASREGVSIRRQLQTALRDTQSLQAINGDLKHQLATQQLETNAMTVQHNTLKDILAERGISPTNLARARNSPRETSPEQGARIRGLEQQLATVMAAHEETKQTFAVQVGVTESAYRDKLTQLENDYQSAVHYVKGTEKMLKQLQEQLTRYKAENNRLKAEVEELEDKSSSGEAGVNGVKGAPAEWETERDVLSQKIGALQADLESSKAQLGKQLQMVQEELEEAKRQRDSAVQTSTEASTRLASTRRDYELLQQESVQLERRAQDAEQRVGMLLDQVESSVGNYRRRSRLIVGGGVVGADQLSVTSGGAGGLGSPTSTIGGATPVLNGSRSLTAEVAGSGGAVQQPAVASHRRQESSEAGSMYGDDANRNSAALDSLANELETLRSHWEATNKNYRLSNAFDFDGPNGSTNGLKEGKEGKEGGTGLGLSEHLADWRKRLDS